MPWPNAMVMVCLGGARLGHHHRLALICVAVGQSWTLSLFGCGWGRRCGSGWGGGDASNLGGPRCNSRVQGQGPASFLLGPRRRLGSLVWPLCGALSISRPLVWPSRQAMIDPYGRVLRVRVVCVVVCVRARPFGRGDAREPKRLALMRPRRDAPTP